MEAKNLFESFTTAQKQAVENMTSATENMNKMFSENMNSDFFKKWYDSQMAFFNNGENKVNNPMEFYNVWMNNQSEAAKAWMNNMPMFNNMNNFMNMDSMTANMNNTMNMYQSWMKSMNNTYSEMMKNYSNMDTKNMMSGMFNNADMYMNMFQLWMPMFKSMNDKSFDMETFKNLFNAPQFKDMMDKMFNMSDISKNMMAMPGMEAFKTNMNNMMDSNKNIFDNLKANAANFMPNNNQLFTQTMDMYNNMNFQMNNAFAPMMKLMGNNATTQQMNNSKELANEFVQYQMRNTEMQYMMYNTGLKAMEELAETVYNDIRNGNETKDFTNLYTTWLTISDKHFVELFSTEEYSKMQADLNSFGMKIKTQINGQMEKALANVPVISRSEMDETYKTIYEMKKRISVLEKQLDADSTEETTKAAPKKTAKNA
jgi:BMFP domain-containing protein YqiC